MLSSTPAAAPLPSTTTEKPSPPPTLGRCRIFRLRPPPAAVPDHLAMRRRLLRLCKDEESLGSSRNAICPARGELHRRACCLQLPFLVVPGHPALA
uniref:Uncharacterized protein n=1 Tax=Oryza sativa subsp. japonica TaxID=39947 RepID=Q6ZHL5_ORYSJ|nr:hypothetical protein [Oryza sativa Japonica Group]